MDDETRKMLRAVINGQSAIKEELGQKIDHLDKKIDQVKSSLSNKIDNVEKKLTKRIDRLGLQIAQLEDDTPARVEHEKLEKRVTKLERKVITA
jgi:hypothetical protein